MDIYKRLEKDHEKQRTLIEQLKNAEAGSARQSELWTQLKVELEAHASAEEQAFYSKLMAEPKGTDEARHAVEEHQEMHEMIAKLDVMDQSSDQWGKLFGKLAHRVIHHVDEEEEDFFPDAKQTLSTSQEQNALETFQQRKQAEVEKQKELAD